MQLFIVLLVVVVVSSLVTKFNRPINRSVQAQVLKRSLLIFLILISFFNIHIRWIHWFASAPTPANAKIDMYPTTDEYDDADLKESEVIMPDGSYAKFFSSVRPNVVLKHFEWMATYG